MSFISVAAGQPIRATHVQQFTNWLTALKLDTPGTIACTSTSDYTLTVRSQDGTTGLALAVQYGAASSPTNIATFNKAGVAMTTGQLLVGTGSAAAPAIAFSGDTNTGRYRTGDDEMADVVGGAISIRHRKGTKFTQVLIGDDTPYSEGIQFFSNGQADADDGDVVLNDFIFTTESNTGGAGVVPDQGAGRFLVYQINPAADAAIRSTEHHVVRAAGAGANTASYCWAIQIGCHSEEPGDGMDKTMGAMIHSSDAPPYNNCVRADTGVWIGGERGWIHPILAMDIDQTTILADLNQYGRLLLAATGGTVATNSFSWVGDEDTGMSRIAANTLVLAAAGTERVRVSATGATFTGVVVIGSTAADLVGFYGSAGVTRPAAYTQTYSTASRTHAAFSSSTLSVSVGTGSTTVSDVGAAFNQTTLNNIVRSLADQINNLRVDLESTRNVLNQVIDDGQSLGLLA